MNSMNSRSALLVILFVVVAVFPGFMSSDGPTVFLIGDSTVADKPLIGNPERGWGQLFPAYFSEEIRFENHARNGRSTKSFLREGLWNTVMERLHPGDFVFIQFGHNDAKKEDSTRYAAPRTDYQENLLRYVHEARAKHAVPVLVTPVCRRRFNDRGEFYDVHGEYPTVVREIGARENVPVIDLNKKSFDWFSRLGVKESEKRFLRADSGVYSAVPKGKRDDTHFMSLGAIEVAGLVVDEIRRLDLPLKKFLKPAGDVAFHGAEKIVLLDNYFNNEWRKDSTGRPVRYHYLWHDTANSGYSILGSCLTRTGAVIDTLCRPPTAELLGRASLYMIVDPDTPTETEDPHYIDQRTASVIARWVEGGGILLLFGNDKGNAEFEHLNACAEQFGIHFNEDSRNRVVGKEYRTGTFDHLPDAPIFRNVHRIFLKEVSTLRLQHPATSVLNDGGDVIMAVSRYGKGMVFAVGDPWLYNEYMDHRRLPEGYDNPKAAENLFQWLFNN